MKGDDHLPQIRYYFNSPEYDGNSGCLYPFLAGACLKELIVMRNTKKSSGMFMSYNKDARYTYLAHLECIEKCIRILFSEPDPSYSIKKLEESKAQKTKVSEPNLTMTKEAQTLFDKLINNKKTKHNT